MCAAISHRYVVLVAKKFLKRLIDSCGFLNKNACINKVWYVCDMYVVVVVFCCFFVQVPLSISTKVISLGISAVHVRHCIYFAEVPGLKTRISPRKG